MSDQGHKADADDHGHGDHGKSGAQKFEIVEENSGVDTFLTYPACALALLILLVFGVSMLTAHPSSETGTYSESHSAGSTK